jgi:hypothetical protein
MKAGRGLGAFTPVSSEANDKSTTCNYTQSEERGAPALDAKAPSWTWRSRVVLRLSLMTLKVTLWGNPTVSVGRNFV